MRTIGNILWFVLAGLWMAIGYVIAGVVQCITIIGIPFGLQSFKLAGYALCRSGGSWSSAWTATRGCPAWAT